MLTKRSAGYVKWTFILAMLIALFSGVGNMPMYGRYYVADIPGFGWSRDFYNNLYLHYLSGAVLMGLATYLPLVYRQRRDRRVRLSKTGALRVWLLGLALVSGVLSALKNLPVVHLSMAGLMAVAFFHLAAAMIALFFSLACGLLKKPWLIDAPRRGSS